jgi:glucose/mannose-6-phosphate isomerase
MNLDDTTKIAEIDTQGILQQIDSLPEQLNSAWKLGFDLPLVRMEEIQNVVLAGMGGSSIGAELMSSLIVDRCPVPVMVLRDYDLPAFTKGSGSLVVLTSFSGNTEETLSAFNQAVQNHCQIVTISTGGRLHELAETGGFAAWKFTHQGPPRSSIAFSFGLLMALFTRLGLVADATSEISAAIIAMSEQRELLSAASPVSNNPAKRLAGQMVGRSVTIFGAGHMAAVARRWKGQINENAKSLANFEVLPEADHNAITGIYFPSQEVEHLMALFLGSSSDHPRNKLRMHLTRQTMMLEGINTDTFIATGASKIEQIWRAVQFGDYVSYYLALCCDVDPAITPGIDNLKQSLN